jgi:hypothetical protein
MVPHAGEQAAPFAVSVQLTPALAGSFTTCAVSVVGGPPTDCPLNFVVIVTVNGKKRIVNVKLSLFVGSVTDIAVIVGVASDPVA